jgi:membrane-associated protein
MNDFLQFLHNLHSADGLRQLIQAGGIFFLIAVVFSETGLLVGFFLPGDSLLVTAGIFSASDGMGGPPLFPLWLLMISLSLAAIIGDQLGYFLGRKAGPMIFKKEDSLFFKKRYLEDSHRFYQERGRRAIIIARFIPIFRTFVPFVAGMARMDYSMYLRFDILGGILWISSMLLLGYFLGKTPLANQLHKVIIVIIFLSLIPLMKPIFQKIFRRL